MRISLVGFNTGRGGIPRVFANLANGLAYNGAAVELCVPDHTTRDLDLIEPSVSIREIGSRGSKSFRSILRLLSHDPPDILVSTREWSNLQATLAKRLRHSPTRLVIRIGIHIAPQLARRNALQRLAKRAGMRYYYPRADLMIANAPGLKQEVQNLMGVPEERVVVLPNTTLPLDFEAQLRQRVHHPFFDAGEPLIVAVGRLARKNDYATLIKAFALVRNARPGKLLILGKGGERDDLEKLVASLDLQAHVSLAGRVQNPYAYMKRADLFVLSSWFEGMPNALIEALASGAQVVSTDCKHGPRDLLRGGQLGRLTPVGDAQAMARAILEALASPAPSHAEKMEIHKAVNAARMYLDTFEELLAGAYD